MLGHYVLWKYAGGLGPVELYYVVGIAAILFVSVELIDRIRKKIKKKPTPDKTKSES